MAEVLDRIGRLSTADSPVTRDEATSIAEVMRNSLRIAPQFAPGTFDGDALFFTATEDVPGAADDFALAPDKAAHWRRHVTGTLHDHPIPCDHYEMTEPGPIAHIAETLRKTLDQHPGPR
ncbi:hypothetical protein REH65_20430 [Saccharopolyspora sp. ID03-671]|uniref:thioesterase domain-containing protein n=1 Tax=Saccharopolyspora sp. ID03-671 TaxID=3073066 RepID=UPI003245C5BB